MLQHQAGSVAALNSASQSEPTLVLRIVGGRSEVSPPHVVNYRRRPRIELEIQLMQNSRRSGQSSRTRGILGQLCGSIIDFVLWLVLRAQYVEEKITDVDREAIHVSSAVAPLIGTASSLLPRLHRHFNSWLVLLLALSVEWALLQ